MPTISEFFGIVIRMYVDNYDPPHFQAGYQGKFAVFDFRGNVLVGDIPSRTATRLIREWVDLHQQELQQNWANMEKGQTFDKISPLT